MPLTNLIGLLEERSRRDGVGITFIETGGTERFLSYRELYTLAGKGLSCLQHAGMRAGDELVFQLPDNRSMVIAFWACVLGGIIPVPLTVSHHDEHKKKLLHVWPLLNNPRLLHADVGSENLPGASFMHIHEEELLTASGRGTIHPAGGDDIAFIQFSSGSTGDPKGVVLTHRNLLTNMRAIADAAGYRDTDSTLSWMPLTHDMGLIGFHLNPLLSGMNQYLMPAALFVRRPGLWLSKASQHKVTILSSPNFGYDYVLRNTDSATRAQWDLSAVRILYNGAEPISLKLCTRFADALKAYGLNRHSLRPVYGLAEASLAVTMSQVGTGILSTSVDRYALRPGDSVRMAVDARDAIDLVSVGTPVNACRLRIAGEEDMPLAEEIVGHIQIRGDNVTDGYYNNGTATARGRTADGWVRTGDLGFIKGGNLYVTGRAKDMLILNGQNYYPADLESIALEIEGIQLNKIAFGGQYNDALQREEALAFVQHRGHLAEFLPLSRQIRALLDARVGIGIDKVIPVKDIPRTTSGKLQRFVLLERYRRGEFDGVIRELEDSQRDSQEVIPAVASSIENRLRALWLRVFGNAGEDLVYAGVSSLKTAQLGMLIWKEFQVELPAGLLYERRNLKEIAAAIGEAGHTAYASLTAATAADRQSYYPLSPAQQSIYHSFRWEKETTAYQVAAAFRLEGELYSDRLQECLRQLVSRHEQLRASFHEKDGSVYRVHEQVDPVLLLRNGDKQDVDQRTPIPLDPGIAPLFRAELLRISDREAYLYLDFHHLITDGISVGLFMEELMQLYSGHPLPPPALQYNDFVRWQTEQLGTAKLYAQREYWRAQLQGPLPVLEMPLDFPRPPLFSTEGARIAGHFGEELSQDLRRLAREHECSLHVVLLSLYAVLLSKYSGQEELLIGIPVSLRRHPDLMALQGMLVNNLVIRSHPSGELTFAGLLHLHKTVLEEALENRDLPFDELLRELGLQRDTGRNPLFDTMFVYQNMDMPVSGDARLSISRYPCDPRTAKYDLTLEVFEEPGPMAYQIEYSTSLFKKETIVRLAGHLETLARSVAADPHNYLRSLSLLDSREYHAAMVSFNATRCDHWGEQTLYPLFLAQAARTPGRVALRFGEEEIGYAALAEKVAAMAAMLRDKGCGKDMPVGLFIPPSPALIIALLAVLKAGGCYLPLGTDLPEEKCRALIRHSRCRLIITARSHAHQLPAGLVDSPEIVLADLTGWESEQSQEALSATVPPAPGDLAYVLYTSGTTGNPKGVMIEHRSLVNYIRWAAARYVGDEQVCFPLFTPVSFDLTVTSVFVPLVTGGTLIIYPDNGPELLIDTVIADNRSHLIKLTPSHLKVLLESKRLDAAGTRIRKLIVGGERLDTRLAEAVHARFNGNIEIFNEYGPTEATVGCMIHLFESGSGVPGVPIGVPADNVRIYLLDKYLAPVPQGVHGELYIAGACLARGYLYNEALTEQQFIADPFVPGERMYKTGDLARRLPSGELDYIGRMDHQIKINGYRIELAEIESAMAGHPSVDEVVATVKTNQLGERRIYAYFTTAAASGPTPDTRDWRDYLSTRLPHYMIPAAFTPVGRIPLTRNGKIDAEQLPLPVADVGSRMAIVPRNDLEAALLKAWKKVLGDAVTMEDNFFESGGDSIKAFQIAARLGEEGVSISVKDILTYHSIAQLCRHVLPAAQTNSYEQGIVTGEIGPSPIAAWFLGWAFSNPHYYHQSVLLRSKRRINPRWLREAFRQLLIHHDGLRINYNPGTGKFFYNNTFLSLEFPLREERIGLTGDADAELEAIGRQIKKEFDITQNLLLRAVLITEPGRPDLLLISAHHLVVDGVSWRILLADLYTVYSALEQSLPVKLPPKTASLTDWEKALAARAVSEGMLEQWSYWEELDREQPPHLLPRLDAAFWQAVHARTITAMLNEKDTSCLQKEAQRVYNSDIPVVLNTALALALQRFAGLTEIVTEQESHGRHLAGPDLSRTTGWFTAIYPVRLSVKGDSVGDDILAIKEQLRQVPENGTGYGLYRYGGKTAFSRNRPAAIRVNYLGELGEEWDNDLFSFSDRRTGPDTDPANCMTAGIEINALIRQERLQIEITFNSKAHEPAAMEELRELILERLQDILRHLQGEREIRLTPSDFDAAGLDAGELNALFYNS